MFLKNYTSDVPVNQTVHRIEQVLIRCGVSGIMKEYTGVNGEIAALIFQLDAPGGKVSIRIPVDKKKALEALWLDYADGDKLTADGSAISWNPRKKKRRVDFADQAERTAWKIMQDWVEVQMSLIQMKQVDTLQVFLPYVMMNAKENYYEQLVASGYRGLLPERTDAG